jgi:hypothetical protein
LDRTTVAISTSEINKLKLRNSVEHIDENIDLLIRRLNRDPDEDFEKISHNLIVSQRSELGKAKYMHIKAYVISEETYINFDHELNIRKVYEEADAIQAAIQEASPYPITVPAGTTWPTRHESERKE